MASLNLQRKTMKPPVRVLALVLMLAVPAAQAIAQPAPPDAVVTAADYRAQMERAFNKQDLNADGYLSNGILVKEMTDEQLAAMDADGDGRISKAEYIAHAMR
ncbi:MAG: hypothetical protein ACN6P8_00700, partial [Achromobacter piechaudii]